VQEALTNVHKHGGGAVARLRLIYDTDELRIDVANVGGVGGSCTDHATGHGIMGMRERAMSVGGWVVAGPADGGPFRLEASLPLLPPAVPVGSGWEGDRHADPSTAGR
jgi:signal transduction histidine kinase